MVEPPERRIRDEEEAGTTFPAQLLEVGDRLVAPARMVPGVDAVFRLGKVEADAAVEAEQLLVPAADHEDPRALRHHGCDQVPEPLGESAVPRALPALVRHPLRTPLLGVTA